MCGIAGIISFKSTHDKSMIGRMTCAMAHRGPDADALFHDGNVSLGHRRLSIIDLSDSANQPFTDNSGRYVMVYNGEMYNYQEVRAKLGDYAFKTSGDTEVLIAAFAKWGTDCIHHFKGMFAFAIWDQEKRELTLMRDRLGVKPLYYFTDGDRFLFSSEVRGILASGWVPKKLNHLAIAEYLSHQSVGYPESIVENVFQLEAGTWMKFSEAGITKGKYWQVSRPPIHQSLSLEETRKKIFELLSASVKRRLVSDVPVGAFLSGGIDSSVVVALMAEVSDAKPNTFNISFEEKDFDESSYARMVAKKFETNHHEIRLKSSVFLDELENALNAMDTPSGDGVNTYVVSKAIREAGITVALSGIGGDELFAGYPFFTKYIGLQKRRRLFKTTKLLRSISSHAIPAGVSVKQDRIRQLIGASSAQIEDVYDVFRQILSPGMIQKLTNLPAGRNSSARAELLKEKEQIARLPLLSQVSVAELLGYTQHTLLKDTDQMSMAVSLEVREPFFDHELVEFVLGIPDNIKTPVYPKSLLVESMQGLLPDEIVHRKKQGFEFPWKHWLRKELFDFCDTRIKRIAERDFIHKEQLLAYWKKFQDGHPSVRWMEIWLFVILEHWIEKNIEN